MTAEPVAARAPKLAPPAWRWLGREAHPTTRARMAELAAERAAGRGEDTILLVEHDPVYTLGRNSDPAHLPGGTERLRALGALCVDVDRGGSVTFHGPGQLVAYPVVRLADRCPTAAADAGDVGAYLRLLEDAVIATCADCGVEATRRPPYTGAWVGGEKVAAIGVKLSHGVTQHGAALNITTDLRWFSEVVPCGITDGGVTSLELLGAVPPAGAALTPAGLAPLLGDHLARLLTPGAYPSAVLARSLSQ